MHYKIQHTKSNPIIISVIMFVFFINLSSCNINSRDIDKKIENCYDANDTIIYLSDLYQEKWDTAYFFDACSLDEIQNRIGRDLPMWRDIGRKILILNKQKNVVYYKEWDMIYENNVKGAVFLFDNDSTINAVPREKAKFLIRKRDNKSYWMILQE